MKKGFTLVELLVVIAILGILMAMMMPAANMILKRTRISNAKGDAGVVASVLLKYQAEYNRWPPVYVLGTSDKTDATWVQIMSVPENALAQLLDDNNFKRILFFEAGGGALVTDGIYAGAWLDPFPSPGGKPFQYLLDQEGDSQMANPDVNEGGEIRARALAWSAGPDGDYTTWEDNVKSWE